MPRKIAYILVFSYLYDDLWDLLKLTVWLQLLMIEHCYPEWECNQQMKIVVGLLKN